jgi:hypothetical protein
MTEKEIWKSLANIVEFGEQYEVSNLGNVRRIGKIEPRKLVEDKDGYLTINFSNKGKVKGYKVHRLVALAFIPNPEDKPEINHKDNVRDNNVLFNLEWSDRVENIDYAKRSGNMNGNQKLSESDVYKIVDDWNTGLYNYSSLANKHNISRLAVTRIIKRQSWTHLELNIKGEN